MRRLISYFFNFILGVTSAAGSGLAFNWSSQPKPEVGYAIVKDGNWLLNDKKFERECMIVRAGDVIKLASSNQFISPKFPKIIVDDCSGRREIRCPTPTDCGAINIPDCRPRTFFARTIAAFKKYFVIDKNGGLAIAANRGSNSQPSLQESVVKLDGGKIDLRPLFSGEPVRRQILRFRPQPVARRAVGKEVRLTFVVAEGASDPLVVPAQGLQPGLYQVVNPVDGADAWVLVAPAGRFAEAAVSFNEASAETNQWGGKVEDDDKRVFLRVWLYQLAAPGKR